MTIVFIGMETSGALRRRFQAAGFETYSCDLLPSEDGGEEMAFADSLPMGRHLQGDVFETLENLWANDMWPTLGIFHPDCTYLTNSAAWAFGDGPYHQRVKPGTLVGADRRQAREAALGQVRAIMALRMPKVIENPPGAIGSNVRKASQIVQPHQFGDDASKATCLWMLDKDNVEIPEMCLPIRRANACTPRMVQYKGRTVARWANQTDSGQNRLSPGLDRWKDRARTYPGIADALVARCVLFLKANA